MPTHTRRTAATLLTAGLAALFAPHALAQAPAAWPTQPVRIVNNFPAGGPADIVARAVADALQKTSGQAVIVENKPGAGGNIGATEVAKAPPDGRTVFFGIDTAFTVNPHIFPKMPFKLGNKPGDLRPLVIISSNGLLLGTSAAKDIRSMPELIGAGKSRGVNFSSGGAGSPGHLGVAIFSQAANIKITHIPYRGNTPAVLALVAGEVDGGILSVSGMLPQVKAGKINAIAFTGRQRSGLLPDVPTVAELGYSDLQNEVLTLCMVPGGTPEPLVAAMQKAVLEALKTPAMLARLATLDMVAENLTGAAANKRLNDLHAHYGKIVKATGMKVE
jgi:tripartite-type tricarboxylate transporter receptor subunit TctC